MLKAVALAARVAERLLGYAIAVLVLYLLVIVALQLVDRHFVDVGFQAPDQLVRIGMVWLCFLGFAAAVQAGINVRIEFVEQWLGPRTRRAMSLLFDVAMLGLCVLLAVKGLRVVEVGAGQALLGTPFTAAVPNAGFLVGIALTGLFLVARILRTLAGAPRSDA